MRPYPFLRTTEFLWHEAHTAHTTNNKAKAQVNEAIKIYKNLFENFLAIPVETGKKSKQETFAGADYSMSCEALLKDGKALQVATAHNLGQNFSKMFNITFKNVNEKNEFVWQTSWGVSTRAIGAIILMHMDEKGLALPPKIAPVQVIIIPIYKNKQEKNSVMKASEKIQEQLKSAKIRNKIDSREQFTPGWKFNEWELKGAPLRIEIGPKEAKNNEITLVRRDNKEKMTVSSKTANKRIQEMLGNIQENLLLKAKKFKTENTHYAESFDKFKKIIKQQRGFVRAGWCGNAKCEHAVKEQTKATTRCIFENKPRKKQKCIYCGKPAISEPLWALSH